MGLIRDASRRSGITAEAGLNAFEVQGEVGPGGEAVIRNQVVDGQTGAGSGMPNERSDGQLGGVPLNSFRCMVWYERLIQIPSTSLDRWTVMGPNEIHGQSLDQATVMPEYAPGTSGSRVKRLNANAGRPSARYFNLFTPSLNTWYSHKFMMNYRYDGSGWLEWWINGVLKVRVTGQMTAEQAGGYWKFANYRNAQINGTAIYDISSCRIYDTEVASLPTPGGSTPPPPPDPTDTAGPTVTVVKPTPNQQVPGNRFDWEVTTDDPSGIDRVEVYLYMTNKFRFATDTTAPYAGTYDITSWQRGNYTFYARAYDKRGNFTEVSVPVSFVTSIPAADTTPPTATFTAPSTVEYNGDILLSATGTDASGIESIQFSFGGATVFTDTTSPYTVSLQAGQYPAGDYTATAIVKDKAGNVTTINRTVTVKPEMTTIEKPNLDEANFLLAQIRESAQSAAITAEAANDLQGVQAWREIYGWAQRSINALHGAADPDPLV